MCSKPRTQPPKSGFNLNLFVQYTQSTQDPITVSNVPLFLTLYVQQNPSVKKLLPFEPTCAVYFEYIVTSNCVRWTYFPDLICSVHKKPSCQKCLLFELICAVYLEYIATFNCDRCTHFSRPYMCSIPRTQPSKSGFHFSLYVQCTQSTQ